MRVDGGDDGGARDVLPDRQGLEETPDLAEPDIVPADSDRCGGGPLLDLSSGKVVHQGTTAGANNEFGKAIRCAAPQGLAGPQQYFRVEVVAGMTYRFTLRPTFQAVLYLFSGCTENIINADCGSGGATGAVAGPIPAGSEGKLLFFPEVSGTFLLAVDSRSAAEAGAFELTAEALSSPPNETCASAAPLALQNGVASVAATTLGAHNEFLAGITCGLGLTFDGPQVYYKLSLELDKWYRFTLGAEFAAGLYVVNGAGECVEGNVEQDCSNITGTVLDPLRSAGTGATLFAPLTAGEHIVAVDSLHPDAAGAFSLLVEEYTPPPGEVCATAVPTTLVDGEALLGGDTSAALNDRGAQMRCGGPPLVGPQRYFSVALDANAYLFSFSTEADAVLAVGQGCVTLPADCESAGVSGASLSVGAGSAGVLYFDAPEAGTYVLAVDGISGAPGGAFQLGIAAASTPANGVCAQPLAIQSGAGPLVIAGDTGPLSNDLQDIDCASGAGGWPGPQAYYQVSLQAGVTYTVALEPEATFDAALYAFPATTPCDALAVNAACAGLASDTVGGGTPETLVLSPAVASDYVLVVDSWSPSDVGTFTLRIAPQ